MESPPEQIEGARTICWVALDRQQLSTDSAGRCWDKGTPVGPTAGLAICRDEKDGGFYLFCCDETWNTIADTCHNTLEQGQGQAEVEFPGTLAAWRVLGHRDRHSPLRLASLLLPELKLFKNEYNAKKAYQAATKIKWRQFVCVFLLMSIILGCALLALAYHWRNSLQLLWLDLLFRVVLYTFPCAAALLLANYWFREPTRRVLREHLQAEGIPICFKCGYNLRGQAEPRCPECSTEFDQELLQKTADHAEHSG